MSIIGPDRDTKVFLSTDRGETEPWGGGCSGASFWHRDYALVSSDGTSITIYDGGNHDNDARAVWSGTPAELKAAAAAQNDGLTASRSVYAQDLIDLKIN